MKSNFKCNNCNCKFYLQKYSITTDDEFKIKSGKILKKITCPTCNSINIDFIGKKDGFGTNFGKFSSSTPLERQQILRKRAKEHSKKHIPNYKDI